VATEEFVKRILIAIACVVLSLPVFAQNADDPASKDDVMLLLRTMHSHDLMQKMMEVQEQSMRQMFHDAILKEKGSVPADFDEQFKRSMGDMIKGMPADEIVQAMVPAYQAHFTHGDIEAMNTFYASPVGQRVLQELPAVTREGMQAAMPILTKYLSDSEEKMKRELGPATKPVSKPKAANPPAQN
jgi:hypothetical protein